MEGQTVIRAFILCLFAASAIAQEFEHGIGQLDQVTKGLVSYWAMRNSGTTVFDEWGTNNGAATASTKFGSQYSAANFGVTFEASSNYFTVSDAPSLRLNTAWALAFWFKPANLTQTNKYILAKAYSGDKDDSFAVLWEYVNNTVELYSDAQTGTALRTGSQIPVSDAEWTFIAYTYDGAVLCGYRNGALIVSPSKTSGIIYDNGSWYIGRRRQLDFTANACSIDEIRIYNRAISSDEVKQLYRMGATPRGLK
jgi:hypothetical protein